MVHFPISLWALTTMCDALALMGYTQVWGFSGLLLALGLAFAIPAMVIGLIDYTGIDDEAAPVANYHLLLMSSAWITYLASFLSRLDGTKLIDQPDLIPIALSGIGLCLMVLGGWYGGQLVYHHGVGTRFQNRKTSEN